MKITALCLPAVALALALGGCEMAGKDHGHGDQAHMHDGHTHGKSGGKATLDRHESMWVSVTRGVAVVYPTKNNSCSGTLNFAQSGDSLQVTGKVTGLKPNGTHAMHIHEFGDQSSDNGDAAGSHYNPGGHPHGAPEADPSARHAGDLGNIKADASGTATINITLKGTTVAGLKNPIIGRSVVIHEKADDFGQPVGNAGGRIGVGVIGVAKAK
jgi:Cu-Zn family superoxide dismutase